MAFFYPIIKVSENQFKTASERAQKEGLNEKVSFALQDYRNESEKYDRIVSVGMFEHVGVKYFRTYLKKTYDLLKENGVFLLHTIGQRGIPTGIPIDIPTDSYAVAIARLCVELICGVIAYVLSLPVASSLMR